MASSSLLWANVRTEKNPHLARMANTYSQIYIHVVFAVHARENLIRSEHKDELQKYMTGIVTAQSHKLIAINNMADHFHLLIGFSSVVGVSGVGCHIKT